MYVHVNCILFYVIEIEVNVRDSVVVFDITHKCEFNGCWAVDWVASKQQQQQQQQNDGKYRGADSFQVFFSFPFLQK